MKKSNLFAFAAALLLVFTSCSTEDSLITNEQNSNLLKTFKLKKDATGAYSLDIDVQNNTKVDKVLDADTNSSKFYLYSTENETQNNFSENLSIDNNKFKVSFIETNTLMKHNITIEDDIKSFSMKNDNDLKLDTYEISGNDEGDFNLNFSVKNNVDVSFVLNEDTNTYEVHLESGKGGQTVFNRTLEKTEGQLLKLDFVNHINNQNAKSNSEALERKPRIIIDQGLAD